MEIYNKHLIARKKAEWGKISWDDFDGIIGVAKANEGN